MSGFTAEFNKRLNDLIDQTVSDFMQKIHERYDIPLKELNEISLSDTAQSTSIKSTTPVTPKNPQFKAADLIGKTTATLKALCKSNGKKNYSKLKKIELISLLTGATASDVPSPVKAKSKSKTKNVPETPQVIKSKIIPSEFKIRRNDNGDYMHSETGLIFDKDTKQVIGKYYPDEGNKNLTEEDIIVCKQYNFSYVLPENLIKKGQVTVSKDKEDNIADLGIPEEDLHSDDGQPESDVDIGLEEEKVVDDDGEEEEVVEEDEEKEQNVED